MQLMKAFTIFEYELKLQEYDLRWVLEVKSGWGFSGSIPTQQLFTRQTCLSSFRNELCCYSHTRIHRETHTNIHTHTCTETHIHSHKHRKRQINSAHTNTLTQKILDTDTIAYSISTSNTRLHDIVGYFMIKVPWNLIHTHTHSSKAKIKECLKMESGFLNAKIL